MIAAMTLVAELQDFLRFLGLAHFFKHAGDEIVGGQIFGEIDRQRRPQRLRFVQLAQPEQHPAHAVENEMILWRQAERLFDQAIRLRQAQLAVGQRVAERVISLGAVRAQFNQSPQTLFHQLDLVQPLGQQGGFIQEVRLVGMLGKQSVEQVEGRLRLFGIA